MKNQREIQAIDRTLEILNKKSKWTKNAEARRKDGSPTREGSEEAVCWCIDGAINIALREQNLSIRKFKNSKSKIIIALLINLGIVPELNTRPDYMDYNDRETTTYHNIINLLKKTKEYLNA